MYQHYTLPDKTNVYLVPQKDVKSITVLVMYAVGSRYEPEKLRGVSHYIEHMMFKGTRRRPNTLKLTREIDRLGAEYNAFTGKEYTGYYIKSDAQYLNTSLDILSDMLFDSLFDPKEMEREKGPIIEEIRMYKDNPLMSIDGRFEDLLYAGCPLGLDIAGTEEHVRSYRRDDVLAYRNLYYQPAHSTIVIAGGVDDTTLPLVERYFGIQKNNKKLFHSYKPFCFGSSAAQSRLMVKHKQTDQVQLMLGFPAYGHQNTRNIPLGVMDTILGGSMSSRLFMQIRVKRGLAYMVRSGSENFRDTGYLYVRAGLEAKNINKAIAVVKQEISKITDKGVTFKELKDAKTHIRGAMTLAMEDSSAQANYYAHQALFFDKIKTPEERLAEMDAVSNEDIIQVARSIFDWTKCRVAVIGDVKADTIIF